jgi:hypothetical protein
VLPAFQLGPPCPLGPDWTTHHLDQSQGVRTGEVKEHVLLLFYGTGNNGKSTQLDTVFHLLGSYATVGEPELLLVKNRGAHPEGIAKLKGAPRGAPQTGLY